MAQDGPLHVLHIDSSSRYAGSVSRRLSARVVARLKEAHPGAEIRVRDLAQGVPPATEIYVNAINKKPETRTPEEVAALAPSDALVEELKWADVVVIGTPMYNFNVPAALKAWIDQVARAGLTFRYTSSGPVGLLENKRAIVAMASGGTPLGAPADFVSPWLRHILGFMGITDVSVVAADRVAVDETSLARAEAQVDALSL